MHTESNGKVSVIIPTYKGASTLARAIRSVLGQSYADFEILVVDDNAPESDARKQTEAVMSAFTDGRVHYLKHQQNKNGSAARNTGIAAATGTYIAFLDDDDIYFKDRVAKSVTALENTPSAGIVFCDVLHAYGQWYGCIHPANPEWLTPKGVLLHGDAVGSGSNLFLRKCVAEKIGGFDESFLRHQDLEFAIRALEAAAPVILNEILVFKCFNETINIPNYEKFYRVKVQYSEKFQYILRTFSAGEQHIFYMDNFRMLYNAALESGKPKNVKQVIQYGREHGCRLSAKQLAKICWFGLGLNKLFTEKNREQKEKLQFDDIFELCGGASEELKSLIYQEGQSQ